MDESELLADRFQGHRPRLRAVAYRLLGSLSEADDAVQETWLRLDRADTRDVTNLGGWLTTVVGRICLDMLRARTARRAGPLDAGLPDPVVRGAETGDPENEALLADSVALALLFCGVSAEARIGLVGGAAGIVASAHGQPTTVMGFAVRDGRIIEIDILTDPVRLRRLEQEAGR
jgi:DNA-directed RNA polymerase specialized sigma24 family protein